MPKNGTNASLDTVIIYTTDMAGLAEFYGKGLELGEPSATGGDHVGFRLPGGYLGFDQVASPPGEPPGAVSLWFEVDDLQATFDRLVTHGGTAKFGPTRKPWGAVLAAVLDPDGNVLGLAQRADAETGGDSTDPGPEEAS
jgi:predicted enzyme related to lactoylglutathione lyase